MWEAVDAGRARGMRCEMRHAGRPLCAREDVVEQIVSRWWWRQLGANNFSSHEFFNSRELPHSAASLAGFRYKLYSAVEMCTRMAIMIRLAKSPRDELDGEDCKAKEYRGEKKEKKHDYG